MKFLLDFVFEWLIVVEIKKGKYVKMDRYRIWNIVGENFKYG